MTKVIKGTKDFRVVKGQKDVRQLRCTVCKELAIQVPDGTGGFVYQCSGCKRKFRFDRI